MGLFVNSHAMGRDGDDDWAVNRLGTGEWGRLRERYASNNRQTFAMRGFYNTKLLLIRQS